MKKFSAVLATVGVFGLVISISAFSDKPNDTIETVTDIVPAMLSVQSTQDVLPGQPTAEFQGLGVDFSNSRLLGNNETAAFYAVPMENEQVCVITVNSDHSPSSMGCTTVDGFGSYGLRVSNNDNSVQGWLASPSVVAAVASKNTRTLGDEARMGWVEKSDIFLISE